jgi:hypothetical protein
MEQMSLTSGLGTELSGPASDISGSRQRIFPSMGIHDVNRNTQRVKKLFTYIATADMFCNHSFKIFDKGFPSQPVTSCLCNLAMDAVTCGCKETMGDNEVGNQFSFLSYPLDIVG